MLKWTYKYKPISTRESESEECGRKDKESTITVRCGKIGVRWDHMLEEERVCMWVKKNEVAKEDVDVNVEVAKIALPAICAGSPSK